MKNNNVVVIAVVVGAIVLVGGGVTAGILLTREDKPVANQAQQEQAKQDTTPAEKKVGKTGVCNTDEIKHLAAGNYVVGQDIASGEYTIKDDGRTDAPFVSLFVHPTKESYTTDEFNNTQIAIFDKNETRTLKLDEGNYIRVVYGGLLTCQ